MINLFGPLRHKTPVFDSEGGGANGGGGGGDKKEKKSTGNMSKGSATKNVGSVSSTGQYAGDGFEWKSHGTNENGSEMLTRTYTGANKNAGLGQDVTSAGGSDNKTKDRIAKISLDEGSRYAASKASSTDGSIGNFLKTGDFGSSPSYAVQQGNKNYTPKITGFTGGSNNAGSFGDAFAAARKSGGPGKTFDFKGKSYTTDLAPAASAAPATSLRPQVRPAAAPAAAPAVDFNAKLEAAGMSDMSGLDSFAATGPYEMMNQFDVEPNAGAVQDYFTTGAGSPGYVAPVDYTKTASGQPFAAAAQLDFSDRGNTFNDSDMVTNNPGGIGSLPGYENTVMNFQNRSSTAEEQAAQLAALDAGGVQMAQNSGSYADMFPAGTVFPDAAESTTDVSNLLDPLGNDPTDYGSGAGGLFAKGLSKFTGMVAGGLGRGIDYFDPAQQYKFGDSSVGVDQLDSSGNVIPEIDMGFAKALGANPNLTGQVKGSENQTAKALLGVEDDFNMLNARAQGNIKNTTFGKAKDAPIFGTGGFGPDPMALLAEVIEAVPTTAGIISTSLASLPAGVLLGSGVTTAELTQDVEKAVTQKVDDGQFGPVSEDQKNRLVQSYVDQTVPYAFGLGAAEALALGAPGRLARGSGLGSRFARPMIPVAEGALSEGFFEPSVVASITEQELQAAGDADGAAVGAVLGLGGSAVNSSLTSGVNKGAVRGETGNFTEAGPIMQGPTTMYGQVLDPTLSPTAGELASSTVESAYDGTAVDLDAFGGTGPVVTPRADNNTQIADQTTLMEQELNQKAQDDATSLLSEKILNDASFKQSATTGNIVELARSLDLPMNQAIEVATEVSETAARETADMLGLIAADEVSTTGSINEDTLAEINAMLTAEMAADVIDQANANESLDGQTGLDLFLENDINTATAKRQAVDRISAAENAKATADAQLLSSMSGIELAPMAPEVTTEVSDLQAQENYNAIAAQEAAYTQTLTETGDAMAAEAAADAAYNNALAPKLSAPEVDGSVVVDNVAPALSTSGVDLSAPEVDGSVVVEDVAEIDTRRPDMLDVQPSITEVEVPVEEQLDLDLGTPIEDTLVEVDAPVVTDVQALPSYDAALSDSAKYLRGIVGDGKSQIDEGTVVDNDLQTEFVEVDVPITMEDQLPAVVRPDMLDAGLDPTTEVTVEDQLPTVIETPTDVSIPLEPIVITDTAPNTMKTVFDNPPLLTNQEVPVKSTKVVRAPTVVNPNVPFNIAYVPPSDGDDDDDPSIPTFTTTDDGVTVGLPSDGGDGVAPVLGTNETGDPTMECPEGYELVSGTNGPTCVKIEESYRLRAGASTQPYTGQTIRPGDTGPGQRRKVIDRRTYTAATPAA